jgi:hypothetical protein
VTRQHPELPRAAWHLRPTLLAAALLAAGMHAPDVWALGLGAIRTKSVIGEPFRAEVTLLGTGDAMPASNCFSLDSPVTAAPDDLPWLSSARIRTQGRTVFISSQQAINEPILMVGLKLGCGFELAREYTLLMQPSGTPLLEEPAADSPPAATPAPPRAISRSTNEGGARAAEASAPPPARTKEARKPRRNKSVSAADRLFVAPNLDAGNGLKMSGGLAQRAEATEAQREALRTEQKLLAALDEQIATHLAIADKVKQLEARMAELQKQLGRTEASLDGGGAPAAPVPPVVSALPESPSIETVPAASVPETGDVEEPDVGPSELVAIDETTSQETPAPPPGGLTNEPVRVINKLPPEPLPGVEAADVPGVNWLIAALGAIAATSILAGGWVWRRRARKLASNAALRSRHAEEAITRLMMEQTTPATEPEARKHAGDAIQRAAAPVDAPTRPVSGLTPALSMGHFPGEAPPEHIDDHEVAVSTPASAGASEVDFDIAAPGGDMMPAAKLDLEFDTFTGSASSFGTPDSNLVASGPRLVSTTPSALSFDQSAQPANEEVPPSHEHVLELAEIMMSFGRADGAAQTLSEFLRDYPKESLIPWLKLLDLYHTSGRRGEYDDLAPKLNRAFNVKVPDWEHFNGPTTSESVEQFGHIMARINASWPNQDCLDYLTELLRDNRAGARIGFPLGVIDDILLLKVVLEWLIANPSMITTQTSRMALI